MPFSIRPYRRLDRFRDGSRKRGGRNIHSTTLRCGVLRKELYFHESLNL